jgi:hypothetical protein
MKSQIRQEIEKIIGVEKRWAYVDGRKNGNYRIKFAFTNPATPKQVNKILSLPHVTKVGYADSNMYHAVTGVTVHFDCRPKLIKIY